MAQKEKTEAVAQVMINILLTVTIQRQQTRGDVPKKAEKQEQDNKQREKFNVI